MKKWRGIVITWAALLVITGCGKQVYIETQRFVIAGGIDFDEEKKLVNYTASTVFSKEAKDKYKVTAATADTLRETRIKVGQKINGNIVSGKLQSFMIGKNLLMQTNVLPYLDAFYRDPKNETNANMIVVDGSVKDVMYTNMSDKGSLGGVIKQLLESTYQSRISVITTLQQFHQQMKDSRITPSLPEMKTEKNELVISGTALLHKDGTYAASLNHQESSLLFLLQRNTKKPIPLTVHIPREISLTDEEMSYASFNIRKINVDFKPIFDESHLTIDIQMKVVIELSERMFTFDMKKKGKTLAQAIEQELKKQCEALIKKAQLHQVDPFGFGIYVSAYDYKNWMKVEEHWVKTFSEATVNYSPTVVIRNIGVAE
ncbi:Ger(x)C family spore germination protein [Paenibacillus aceris]|uniref:Ger(X)C family germination protein n=1 Tax=Paenibacillus aceris TaxID=869555 RepID=A0ABS4HUJ2_9BACL|nr:Ger(x)C family spore germination protein [Paenibacillus aceris]MBP1962283.1 Ger(x)C family germination protein [Paenibacillus aceris]NHW37109.1 Ger(x)C family spore germination protein [Paenibacillus aceris]